MHPFVEVTLGAGRATGPLREGQGAVSPGRAAGARGPNGVKQKASSKFGRFLQQTCEGGHKFQPIEVGPPTK
jgi:hypothetical protein